MTPTRTKVSFKQTTADIQKLLGPNFRMADYVTPQVVERCQQLIDTARQSFYVDAEADLMRLEALVKSEMNPVQLRLVSDHALKIRSLSRLLNFTLITEVCSHIMAASVYAFLPEEKQKALMQKLAEALRLAFDDRIESEGGASSQLLLRELRLLFNG